MSSPPPIRVVCAVLMNDSGHVFVAQRPAHKHLGLKWEFPGGKVEPGEAPADGLHRELREELGCTAEFTQELPAFVHHYGEVAIEMIAFVGRLAPDSPAPQAHEHAALRWVGPAELDALDLAAADRPVVAMLQQQRSRA